LRQRRQGTPCPGVCGETSVTGLTVNGVHTMLIYSGQGVPAEGVGTTWFAGAVAHNEKVLYELAPGEQVVDLGLGGVVSRQVEVLDAAGLRAECGGHADGLHDVHLTRLMQARDEGWAGLAVATGGEVLAAVTDDPAAAHEHGVSRLVVEYGMSALCRYRPGEPWGFLEPMLAAHYRDVDDDLWGATRDGDRLCLRGEIDSGNVARFALVLGGAVAGGLRVVDLTELKFCSVAGMRTIAAVAQSVATRGEQLVLLGGCAPVRRILTLFGLADHPGVRLGGGQ
jgi:anti-anti-sigma factor